MAPGVAQHPAELVDVHGLDVAYRRRGEGETVLYLHGLGLTRRWLPFHEALAAGADVVAPEHPGFGATPLPAWLEGFDDLIVHYAEVIDALDLGPVHLVGYSFGGWIAAELAAFFPERLRSLTLIAPWGLRVPGHTPTDVYRMSHDAFLDLCLNGDAGAYPDAADPDPAEALFQSYAESIALAKVAWNPRYDRKLDRRLARVTAPALVIAAQDDRILPRAHVDRYAELLSARVETVEGADRPTGHGLVVQEPERLARQVLTQIGDR